MSLFDHASVGVSDVHRATKFYDGLLATVGAKRLAEHERFAAYGVRTLEFFVMAPYDGAAATAGNGVHVAFRAPDAASVSAFHAWALAHGGSCEGPPGPRPGYPRSDVFIAYVRDPFGNKLEVIAGGFAA